MPTPTPINTAQARYLLAVIMVAVLTWGVFHAFGAPRYNGNPWRGVIVMAFFGGFVGFWWLLLAGRRRRTSEPSEK